MKVLHVINSLEPAGAEVLLKDLLPRLAERGCEPEVFLLRSTNSWIEQEVCRKTVVYQGGLGALYSPMRLLRLLTHLWSNAQRYNAIHVHLFPAQLAVALASSLLGLRLPILATEHNTTNRRRKAFFRWLDQWMYQRFSLVNGVSNGVSENLAAWLGCECGPVVWNGIDLTRFDTVRSNHLKRELGTELPLVLSIGRFHEQKDHETAIRAIQLCSAGLVLVGEGDELDKCKELARTLGVSDRVWFLGRREDIPQVISGCDMYVQCSRWEGFGIAAVEAMASGLPVIGTDVAGFRDVVSDAGLLFRPGDYLDLARIVTCVLGDQAIREKLSALSCERAKHFDIEKTADRYCRLYTELSALSSRSRDRAEIAVGEQVGS